MKKNKFPKSYLLFFLLCFIQVSCKKEVLFNAQAPIEDDKSLESTIKNIPNTIYPSLNIEEAKSWYNTNFSGTKTSFGESDILFNAKPNWDLVYRSSNKKGQSFLLAPLNLIPKDRGTSRIILTKNINGEWLGKLGIFIPDKDYHINKKNKNLDYDTKDFSGSIIYTTLEGKFMYGLSVKKGKVQGTSIAKLSGSSSNQLQDRCWTEVESICIYDINIAVQLQCVVSMEITTTTCYTESTDSNIFSMGNGSPATATGGSGNFTDVTPTSVFSADQLTAMRTEYLSKGFTIDLWDNLKDNPQVLEKTDQFLRKHAFDDQSIEIIKSLEDEINDPDLIKVMNSWPTIPAFLWSMMKDLGIEIAVKMIQKYVPGFNEIENIKSAMQNIQHGEWLDLMYDVYNIAKTELKSLKKKIPWIAAYEILFVDGKKYFNIIQKLWEPLYNLGSKLSGEQFSKLWTAVNKNRDFFDKFDIFGDGSGFLKYSNGSLKDLFHTIRAEFGVGYQNETNGNGIYFDFGDLRLTWYPISSTNQSPALEIRKGGTIIIKIRQP